MLHRFLLIATLAGCVVPSTANACTEYTDTGRLFSFGRYELGADRSALPASIRRLDNCYEEPADNYYDCTYADDDGVEYLVFGHEIVRKDIRRVADYSGHLIAGIGDGDTLRTALRKVQSLTDDLQNWQADLARYGNRDEIFLSPNVCLHQHSGALFWFDLIFDKNDKLVGITAMYEPQ